MIKKIFEAKQKTGNVVLEDTNQCGEGKFSNIKNNPLGQTKMVKETKARYIKLSALRNADSNNNIG